jgi:hypothetical protein
MWHQRRFIRPKQETANAPARADGTGITAVSARSLAYALNDIPEMVYAEVAWLDNGQLARLAKAASLVNQAASAELNGRDPR